jgi:hypothetical protein
MYSFLKWPHPFTVELCSSPGWLQNTSNCLNLKQLEKKIQFSITVSHIASAQWPHVSGGCRMDATGLQDTHCHTKLCWAALLQSQNQHKKAKFWVTPSAEQVAEMRAVLSLLNSFWVKWHEMFFASTTQKAIDSNLIWSSLKQVTSKWERWFSLSWDKDFQPRLDLDRLSHSAFHCPVPASTPETEGLGFLISSAFFPTSDGRSSNHTALKSLKTSVVVTWVKVGLGLNWLSEQ